MSDALSVTNNAVEKARGGVRILSGFTIAHGVFHFMQQSFAVMLPAIKEAFGMKATLFFAALLFAISAFTLTTADLKMPASREMRSIQD
jgi:hypothetical protein